MNFIKKYLKVIGIIIVIYVISMPLGIFFFENTPWKNGIAGSVESPESITFQIFITISVLYYTFATKKFVLLKFFIGILVFTGLMVLLIEMGITSEGIEEYKWLIIIGCIPVVLIIMRINNVRGAAVRKLNLNLELKVIGFGNIEIKTVQKIKG